MTIETGNGLGGFIRSVGSKIGFQINTIEGRALAVLEIKSNQKGAIQDAINSLGINDAWNTNARESNGGTSLDYTHIAECLLSSTKNFIDCINTLGSEGGGAEAVVYGIIIDDRVITTAEEKQKEFKRRALHDELDLLNPNTPIQRVLDHIGKLKQYLSYNQVIRLLKIYGFSEEKNPIQ